MMIDIVTQTSVATKEQRDAAALLIANYFNLTFANLAVDERMMRVINSEVSYLLEKLREGTQWRLPAMKVDRLAFSRDVLMYWDLDGAWVPAL
jgi:hypothetical protein